MAANEEYYRLLDEAIGTGPCAFTPVRGRHLSETSYPYLHPLWLAVQALVVRASVLATRGQIDAAAASAAQISRLARHVTHPPSLPAANMASTLDAQAALTLSDAFARGTPSPATCRHLFLLFSRGDWQDDCFRAMEWERAEGLSWFDRLDAGEPTLDAGRIVELDGPPPVWPSLEYRTLNRPGLHRDKLHYLDLAERNLAAFQHPWRQALVEIGAARRAEESLPPQEALMTVIFTPSLRRALWSRDESRARLATAQAALAAVAYRGEHGAYPASLPDLTRAGWTLLPDPFTDAPLRYRRDRAGGFTVWSVGPDLTDNDGLDYDLARVDYQKPGYDFAFHVGR